jgi:hypothetical protein
MAALAAAPVDVAILEVADGLLQPETAALLRSAWFGTLVDAALFASGDAMAARTGVEQLRREGLRVLAACGRITSSPLEQREAHLATEAPVLSSRELGDAITARKLVDHARS